MEDEGMSEAYMQDLMTIKSSAIYDKWWNRYNLYSSERSKNVDDVTTFLNWLCSMKQQFSGSTIISAGSCVNSRIKLLHQKNFMDHMLVKDVIKKLHRNHVPKQACVFTKEQIDRFVLNAPEHMHFLVKKLVALIGIQGALRISEITNLEFNDITFMPNGSVNVRIKSSKTDTAGRGHSFIITPNCDKKLCLVIRLRNYINDFNIKSGKLFRNVSKVGKLLNPIGINTMGRIPRIIAEFLELSNADEFTGHSFRRTSATFLSEKGIGLVELKQHGRWKSSSVAEGYVNNTNVAKTKASNMLQNVVENGVVSNETLGPSAFLHCSFVNCNISMGSHI